MNDRPHPAPFESGNPASVVGTAMPRVDGRAKVTGAARYTSDVVVPNPAHAVLVTSAIARGRIIGFDLAAANAVPGVLDILTHHNVGGEAKPAPDGLGGPSTTTLETEWIWFSGQIVALVVADTLEAAVDAANKVVVSTEAVAPSAGFGAPGVKEQTAADAHKEHKDPAVGDAPAALAEAPISIDARYSTPTQHHNCMELFNTTCVWEENRLIIYEGSQFVHGLRAGVARQLGLDAAQVHVLSKFVGGAFGARGATTARTAWVAIAARRLRRPVKLQSTRRQAFTIATYRAETEHRVRLGASLDGRLQALIHEGWELTSRPSGYKVGGTSTTASLYACPNVRTKVTLVHADRATPGFMRAPPETPYMFALESAMDELAYALKIDPIELRRRNDTLVDPITNTPFTSRGLMPCFDEASRVFGWHQRVPEPRSMQDGDWLIGWGCATATYPSNISPAGANVTLRADGRVSVAIGAHEIGNGATTILVMLAADRLGVDPAKIDVELGDSHLRPAGLAAGSSHTASFANAVADACEAIRTRLANSASLANESPLTGIDPRQLRLFDEGLVALDGAFESLERVLSRLGGSIEVEIDHLPEHAPADSMDRLAKGMVTMVRGSDVPEERRYSFGAQLVEVRVHRQTCEIRVARAVGAFAAGHILNPMLARSQYLGGMIWGIGAALHEETILDTRTARYVNDTLAEYHIPVNADIRDLQVIMLPEDDLRPNPLGIKGIGEIGMVGMNAAIANAVFHATGKRVRDLPIRIEDLL